MQRADRGQRRERGVAQQAARRGQEKGSLDSLQRQVSLTELMRQAAVFAARSRRRPGQSQVEVEKLLDVKLIIALHFYFSDFVPLAGFFRRAADSDSLSRTR